MAKSIPWQQRMWARVDVGWEHECWEWQGFRRSFGYGQIGLGSRDKGIGETHRLAYEFFNGPIPAGMVVRHTCDNPPCCNPAHLRIGTHADNVRDMIERGRGAREFRLPHTKLSDEQVREIRRRYNPRHRRYIRGWASNGDELAAEYGISRMYLSQLIHRKYRVNV